MQEGAESGDLGESDPGQQSEVDLGRNDVDSGRVSTRSGRSRKMPARFNDYDMD